MAGIQPGNLQKPPDSGGIGRSMDNFKTTFNHLQISNKREFGTACAGAWQPFLSDQSFSLFRLLQPWIKSAH